MTASGYSYLAIGTGDTGFNIFAGMRAVAVISIRVFLVRGLGASLGQGSRPFPIKRACKRDHLDHA
jgi:hypothetical protein